MIWPTQYVNISRITHYHLLTIVVIDSTEAKLNAISFICSSIIDSCRSSSYTNEYYNRLVVWGLLAMYSYGYITSVITKLDSCNVFKLDILFKIANSAYYIIIKVSGP